LRISEVGFLTTSLLSPHDKTVENLDQQNENSGNFVAEFQLFCPSVRLLTYRGNIAAWLT